jgi:hypothetical protein
MIRASPLQVYVVNFPKSAQVELEGAATPKRGVKKGRTPVVRSRGVDPNTQQKLDGLLFEQTLRGLQLPTR